MKNFQNKRMRNTERLHFKNYPIIANAFYFLSSCDKNILLILINILAHYDINIIKKIVALR